MNFFFLFFLLAYAEFTIATVIQGVRKRDLSLYSGSSFTCLDKSKTIPSSYINDQYCDCELDGSDEPGTSACSNGHFFCKNKGFRGDIIPSSRVHDGVCDCCDGSDEVAGRCEDQCTLLGKEAQKDVLKEIAEIEEGVNIKQKWIEEAKATKLQKEAELETLKQELIAKEATMEAAKARKLEEEEIEKVERERLNAIREAKKAEEEAAKNQSEPITPENSVKTEDVSQGAQVATPEGGDVQAEVASFPYPQEYAFKPEEAGEPAEATTGEPAAAFPYPQEYAAPPAATESQTTGTAQKSVPELATPLPEVTEGGGEDEDEEDPEPEGYRSEAADKARKIYDDAENERRDAQSKVEKVEGWLKQDYGENLEFGKLHDQCWSHTIRQYTYEVCPYDRAEQKESGRGTSLGHWRGFFDPSQITETQIRLDESMYSKVMKFDGGATCWNGPARSLIVSLKCAPTTEVTQVEEPSKCVYTATLRTPSVCSMQHAQALKLGLESGIFDEEE